MPALALKIGYFWLIFGSKPTSCLDCWQAACGSFLHDRFSIRVLCTHLAVVSKEYGGPHREQLQKVDMYI